MGFGTDKAVVGCFQLLDPSLQALGGSSLRLLIAVLIGVEESLQSVDASLEGSIGACACLLCSVKAGLVGVFQLLDFGLQASIGGGDGFLGA